MAAGKKRRERNQQQFTSVTVYPKPLMAGEQSLCTRLLLIPMPFPLGL